MTVVYIDSFLLVNFVLNFLLLLACGKLSGEAIRIWRCIAAALFGAIYAVLAFFPRFEFFLHPVYKLSVALFIILIAFGNSRRLLRIAAIFLAISCAFCGGILAIEFLKGGYMNDSIVYSAIDIKGLFISALFCYGVLALFFQGAAVHHVRSGDLSEITLTQDGRSISLTALRDSGNTLRDPVNGREVIIIEAEPLLAILSKEWNLDASMLQNPILAMETPRPAETRSKFRLLPYRAVGVDCGMLLALRLDQLTIDGKEYPNHLVALSPTPLTDGGSYRALIHCS